ADRPAAPRPFRSAPVGYSKADRIRRQSQGMPKGYTARNIWASTSISSGVLFPLRRAPSQFRINERLQIPVEHLLRVPPFHARSQILHARIIQHVIANLIPPRDFALGADDLRQLGVALGFLELLQLGLNDAQAHALVLRLAALVHAFNRDARRNML